MKAPAYLFTMCAEMLAELAKREKQAGIFPEKDVDVYMKATAVEGMKSSLSTDYIMKVFFHTRTPNYSYSSYLHRYHLGSYVQLF